MLSGLVDKLGRMKAAVFTSIAGYTMTDADALRAKGREQGVELTVAKKTLLSKALEQKGLVPEKGMLQGSILATFGMDDEVAPAKLVSDLSKGKDKEGIKIVGGILEGKFVGPEAVSALAKLVSKHHQQGRVVGTMYAPVSAFVRVLEAIRAKQAA
ncbi:50S ribosomal protein L10 [Candidatus Uhrbacteria bacterium RIFCSPHIGHO2_01_FULL_63_20]|uniref:Large ribosomal subunit protein uL10 n=1 Tax=Candidatus Uhrbacteria bacterium RIFCSPHIGHO2_01_FULL_63_20 TaxID=1802385 RepID=A0A1F7TMK8_9BACT|nr:MAG: 50S ribosomal protein L10 [Candidatus Uhrbacteria bacterium RIFCSPHIGHO2_01_FULL_63_20]